MNTSPEKFEPVHSSYLYSIPDDLIVLLDDSDFDESLRDIIVGSADYVYNLLIEMAKK